MYTLDTYYEDILTYGLEKTWNKILENNIPLYSQDFKIEYLGERYEDGLAKINKIEKKEMGKYYTPQDVATVMAQELLTLPESNICDVCCGTGNLILALFNCLSKDKVVNLIKNKKIYLYDIDPIAIKICQYIIGALYGFENINNLQCITGDFLSSNIQLPSECKVISNPPYGKITKIDKNWDEQIIANESKDYYAAIMAKIIRNSNFSCIITPHSFMYGDKFKNLRKLMCQYGGKIFAFDNVPGNIFNGKKFGIFNSNNVNSVRAAITIITNEYQGYKVSPFIRFKNTERSNILNYYFLNSILPNNIQSNSQCFYRIAQGTEQLIKKWISYPPLKNYISKTPNKFKLVIPNTCRYFLSGVTYDLKRTGKIIIYAKDYESFYYLYAMLNSSLGYYWHRICNGGITYPISLLKEMPIINFDINEIKDFLDGLISCEKNYLVIAKNAGAEQENIKFSDDQRNFLNKYFCQVLGIEYNENIFQQLHQNSILTN